MPISGRSNLNDPHKSPRLRTHDPKRPRRKGREHYGTLHQKLRPVVLARNPICQACENALSEEADHLVYPALTADDYQALCKPCHRKKTRGG
jgi:5-methylcytosine-specific restriction endonuclease McrA